MKIELSNGKTIDMPIEKFIDLSDSEYDDFIEHMMSIDAGYNISDPFSNIYVPSTTLTLEDVPLEQLPDEVVDNIKKEFDDEEG